MNVHQNTLRLLLAFGLCLFAMTSLVAYTTRMSDKPLDTKSLDDDHFRATLSPEQYRVLREKGTERAFCGLLWNEHREGTYYCAACGQKLFEAGSKFDSGTGWPSFFQPAEAGAVETHRDVSHGMIRDEVVCSKCQSHLGHVYDDGTPTTHQRNSKNSVSIRFEPKE